MKFDLNEFDSLGKEEQKKYLIAYGQAFFKTMEVAPTQDDLSKIGITYVQMRYRFGNLRNYHVACEISSPIRQRNMSDDELKNHLIKMCDSNKINENCPSFSRKESVCYLKCDCWIPQNRYITENNRTNIRYKGEFWQLHRLSFYLFNGPIGDNFVLHLCDNSLCINPEHLILGDSADNMNPKHTNGRHIHKEKAVSDHNLRDAYDKSALLTLIKERCNITSEGEWLYKFCKINGYPRIMINGKLYTLSKLILANKLGKKYEEINIARHLLPDGSPGQRHDLNPDHLHDGTRSQNACDEISNLTKDDVTYIRETAPKLILKRGDATLFDIKMSEKFNVSVNTISNIRKGTSYTVFHDGSSTAKILTKPVIQFDLQGNFIREYSSITEALLINNFKSKNMIQDVCNGKCKTYMGFIWKYKN